MGDLLVCSEHGSVCCAGLRTCTREVRLPENAAGLAATAALEPSRDVMAAAFAILIPFSGPARVLSAAPVIGSSLSLAWKPYPKPWDEISGSSAAETATLQILGKTHHAG